MITHALSLLCALAPFSAAPASLTPLVSIEPPSRVPVDQRDSWDEISRKFGGVKADTKASRDVVMAFTVSAEVREVFVQGGQRVRQGDMLVRARDADQVAIVDAQRISAGNDNEVKAAALQLELYQLRYARLKESGQAGIAELDEARIQEATGKVQLEQAKVRASLEKKRLDQAEGQLERYRLVAPFDGVIEEVKVDVGQGVREAEPALRVVNTEQLWIEAYAPTTETIRAGLTRDKPAWVLLDMPDRPKLVEGKILYVSPVADSVSLKRRVRVEIQNTQGWPAGTPAMVVFEKPDDSWDPYRVTQPTTAARTGSDQR
ncbi:MAG: efflux RND transporter periplasmic adaptor subunit [Phycisphaerales bacterium]